MSKFARLVGILMVAFSLLAASEGIVYAQDGGGVLRVSRPANPKSAGQGGGTTKYFQETGHNVSGEFWKYYQGIPNADLVFGYPLTEAFNDVHSGRVVQYFTRARFELHPEQPEGQRVRLSPLGSSTYMAGQGVSVFTPMGCRTFANGFAVCYAFLDFFDKYGGETVFGQPISGFEFLDGRIVQYFERARFGWYPEYGEGQKVALADLGRIYFDVAKEDANRLQPVRYDGIVDVLTLQTRAFVWKAVTQANDQQAVYVVVQDQMFNPVYNATVVVTVYWSTGSPQSIALATDSNGIVIVPFAILSQPVGSLVTVNVQVLYQGMQSNTVTSFRVWQ